MNFCENCKWSGGRNDLYCMHKNNINPGTGRPELSCETQRMVSWIVAIVGGMCGRSGRWFEKKESVN